VDLLRLRVASALYSAILCTQIGVVSRTRVLSSFPKPELEEAFFQ